MVVRRRQRVDLRKILEHLRHGALAVRLLVIAGDGGEHLDPGCFRQRLLVAAQPLAVGRRARGTLEDDDLAFAA